MGSRLVERDFWIAYWITGKPAVILRGKPVKLIWKQALILGAAQGLDEAGKLEDLDVGGTGGPIMVPADDYVAAG